MFMNVIEAPACSSSAQTTNTSQENETLLTCFDSRQGWWWRVDGSEIIYPSLAVS